MLVVDNAGSGPWVAVRDEVQVTHQLASHWEVSELEVTVCVYFLSFPAATIGQIHNAFARYVFLTI